MVYAMSSSFWELQKRLVSSAFLLFKKLPVPCFHPDPAKQVFYRVGDFEADPYIGVSFIYAYVLTPLAIYKAAEYYRIEHYGETEEQSKTRVKAQAHCKMFRSHWAHIRNHNLPAEQKRLGIQCEEACRQHDLFLKSMFNEMSKRRWWKIGDEAHYEIRTEGGYADKRLESGEIHASGPKSDEHIESFFEEYNQVKARR